MIIPRNATITRYHDDIEQSVQTNECVNMKNGQPIITDEIMIYSTWKNKVKNVNVNFEICDCEIVMITSPKLDVDTIYCLFALLYCTLLWLFHKCMCTKLSAVYCQLFI